MSETQKSKTELDRIPTGSPHLMQICMTRNLYPKRSTWIQKKRMYGRKLERTIFAARRCRYVFFE